MLLPVLKWSFSFLIMKKVILILGTILVTVLGIVACSKKSKNSILEPDTVISPPSSDINEDSMINARLLFNDTVLRSKMQVFFYLDNILIPDSITDLENYFPVYSAQKDVSDSSAVITVNLFSNEESYFEYGDLHNLKFRENKDLEIAINNYALDYHLIDIEDDDSLSTADKDSIINIYNYIFNPTPPPPFIFAGALTMYDDIIDYGPNIYNPNALSLALGNWNDRVGCFETLSLYSVIHIYDKTFLRKKMATIATWGLTEISFANTFGRGFLNNRMSSFVHNFLF